MEVEIYINGKLPELPESKQPKICTEWVKFNSHQWGIDSKKMSPSPIELKLLKAHLYRGIWPSRALHFNQ